MKNQFTILRLGILLTISIHALPTIAQRTTQSSTPCNYVSELGINTGYDYNTNALVADGQQDPEWIITNLTTDCSTLTGALPVGSNAYVFSSTGSWWANSTNSKWLSFIDPPEYTTGGGTDYYVYGMTLTRHFTVCSADSFIFNLRLADDNYCKSIKIDGIPIPITFSQPPTTTTTYSSAFTSLPSFAIFLNSGTHSISLEVYNYPYPGPTNKHGLDLEGTIQSVQGSTTLIGPGSSANCPCVQSCSDSCYWKVYGNNIINGNNIFGTLSNDDIDIQTSSTNRGIITRQGLLGWNTMSPTAYLHVNCNGHNKPDGHLSDVRFENLEPGKGTVLVINEDGYVLNSRIDIAQLQADNEKLENEVKALSQQVSELSAKISSSASKSKLYQNVPNPFSDATTIKCYIDNMETNAFIIICDLNGKQLKRYQLNKMGDSSIDVSLSDLYSGTYLYSLIIDNTLIDTRKMVLIK